MKDILGILRKIKNIKLILIAAGIGIVFIFIIFPIMSVFFENKESTNSIANYGMVGIPVYEGGNDYREIKSGSKEEEDLLKYLQESELWHTSVKASQQQQVEWYKRLSKELEETYIDGQESRNSIKTEAAKSSYKTNHNCKRNTKSDYANEECNTNGNTSNYKDYTIFQWNANPKDGIKKEICDDYKKGKIPIYTPVSGTKMYYRSSEDKHIPGGKILGLYPDMIVSSAIGNTYTTYDQNKINNTNDEVTNYYNKFCKDEEYYDSHSEIWDKCDDYERYMNVITHTTNSYIQNLMFGIIDEILNWFATNTIASADDALNDTFDEGSLYSTFHFYPESTCTVTDVVRYSLGPSEFPKGYNEDGVETPYDCVRQKSGYTECVEEPYTYSCAGNCGSEGAYCTNCCTCNGIRYYASKYMTTDGNPSTYYWANNASYNSKVSSTIEPRSYVDGVRGEALESGDGKYCDYLKDVGKDTIFALSVDWVCIPNKPKDDDPHITCEVTPVRDDMDRILYYRCSSISEEAVRKVLVDPIFDAYEANDKEKVANEYMTVETANKYIYGFDKSKYTDEINPEGYKIDDTTREIVTKHLVAEILGGTEGRTAAIATEEGYFYLNSYNRVLNIEQYKDALYNTLFVKDDIIESAEQLGNIDKNNLSEDTYSRKLYGMFYSPYNSAFDLWSEDEIDQQQRIDIARKNSLIIEIFDTYEYISKYLKDYNVNVMTTLGKGLGQVDASGYSPRVEMPYYGSAAYNKYYTYGYYGECAWYATGRIKEILNNTSVNISANGGDFCTVAQQLYPDEFEYRTDPEGYKYPEKGAVISWSGGITTSPCPARGCGHVAIIEEVLYDDNGNITGAVISEGGLGVGGVLGGGLTRYDVWNGGGSRITACANGACFKTRTLSLQQLKNYGTGYKFECYIYLLKDEDNESNSGNEQNPEPTNDCDADSQDIINTINSKFNNGHGMANKLQYWNYVTKTEGGNNLNSSDLNDINKLLQGVKMTGTIEVSPYASVDPGMYIGLINETYSVTTNSGKTCSFDIKVGEYIPRWVTLYKWVSDYDLHYNSAVQALQNKGINPNTLPASRIHLLMRTSYTYGIDGAKSRIDSIVDSYKSGSDQDVWCNMSLWLLSYNKSLENYELFENYFNSAEMNMDLYLTGKYPEKSPEYKNFKYYTKDYVAKILATAKAKGYSLYPNGNSINGATYSSKSSGYDCSGYPLVIR